MLNCRERGKEASISSPTSGIFPSFKKKHEREIYIYIARESEERGNIKKRIEKRKRKTRETANFWTKL